VNISWDIIGKHRVDIVAWSKPDMVARKSVVQIFPSGQQGELRTADVASMVIRAPLGTRLTLMTDSTSERWAHSWRCIRLLPGHVVPPSRRNGLPGVRLPDLDRLDPVGSRRTDRDLESSYPLTEHPEQGTSWTFGAVGPAPLKGNVIGIRVEREDADDKVETAPSREQPTTATALPSVASRPDHRVVPVAFGSPVELAAALDEIVREDETISALLPRPDAKDQEQVWVVLRRRH
jgi:hypothetical protein